MSRKSSRWLGAAIAAFYAASSAQAGLVLNNLAGNVEYDGWNSLTGTTPGLSTSTLVAGFGSNEAGSGDAILRRTSGAHYPASASLYSFSTNSTFELADTVSLTDVNTVVFSIFTWPNGDGSTPAGSIASGPFLNFNGGSQSLAADYVGVLPVGTIEFGGPIPTYTYTFQWDLSSIDEDILSYDVDWTQIVHSGVLGLQLESSDIFSLSSAVAAVPEPASAGIIFGGAMTLVGGMVRRRTKTVAG